MKLSVMSAIAAIKEDIKDDSYLKDKILHVHP